MFDAYYAIIIQLVECDPAIGLSTALDRGRYAAARPPYSDIGTMPPFLCIFCPSYLLRL